MSSATESRKRSIFDDSDDDDDTNVSPKKIVVYEDDDILSKAVEKYDDDDILSKAVEKYDDEDNSPLKQNGEGSSPNKRILTAAQRAKMEKNRQTALLIKQKKMNKILPSIVEEKKNDEKKRIIKINNEALVDTGGGFFIEEETKLTQEDINDAKLLISEPAPLFEEDRPNCLECAELFNSSYLLHNFDHRVCDDCRDNEDQHRLITKTDAKNEYLLKDVDLDVRKPPLKYILRKNPHNDRWGDMKLYLKTQIEKRALEVWESEEAIEEAIVKKEEQKDLNRKKKFDKKMKELRMNVRSSLYTRSTKTHEHEYEEEVYLPDEDEYSKTCKTCGHSYTYDKM